MKAKLLALAAFLAAAGAGVYFVDFDTGGVTAMAESFGNFEVVDKSQCSMGPCNTAQCNASRNILADAGSPCLLRLVECPVRLGQRARNQAADAGVAFPAGKYHQVQFVAVRCAAAGGGFSLGVPVDDAGFPVNAVSSVPHPCAWKPTAGATCARADGGNPGVENTMQPGNWVGAGCVRKACVEFAGESSAP
jgi:hypothetical protein